MNIEIKRVLRHWFPGETRDVVGEFDAHIGDFIIRRGAIWKDHKTGQAYALVPGRERSRGVSIKPGELQDAICAAALAAWEALP